MWLVPKKKLSPEAYLQRLLLAPRSYMQLVLKFRSKGYSREELDKLLGRWGIEREELDRQFLDALCEGAVRKGKGPLWFRRRALGLVEGRMLDEYLERKDVWKQSLRVAVGRCKRKGLIWSDCWTYLVRQGFTSEYCDIARMFYEEVEGE